MLALALASGLVSTGAAARQPPAAAVRPDAVAASRGAESAAEAPADYIISPEDVLSVVLARQGHDGDVAVRSDGKIRCRFSTTCRRPA
jgi:hypothetical protein